MQALFAVLQEGGNKTPSFTQFYSTKIWIFYGEEFYGKPLLYYPFPRKEKLSSQAVDVV